MIRVLSAVTLVTVLTAMVASASRAAVIYSYTGNNFTSISNNEPSLGTFDSGMRVTGSFTLANALPPNLFASQVTPISYAFSDGVSTIADEADYAPVFFISTDTQGQIFGWSVGLLFPFSAFHVGDVVSNILFSSNTFPADFAEVRSCVIATTVSCPVLSPGNAAFTNTPGRWTSAVVPEPAVLSLFVTGLAGLGFSRRKRYLIQPVTTRSGSFFVA